MISPEQAHKDLDRFRELEYDWDSYEAEPITETALTLAHVMVDTHPDWISHVAPIPNGGVQIEWFSNGPFEFEVDIGPEGELGFLLITRTYHEEDNVSLERIYDYLNLVVQPRAAPIFKKKKGEKDGDGERSSAKGESQR